MLRSAVWLLIYWTKYCTSQFVIVLTIRLNYASDYIPDRVLQVSVKRLLIVKAKFHYASWFGAGSGLVRRWFELKFGLSLLSTN